eukprot:7761805-Pyramimonas_sp.AAC.1
MGGGRVGQDRPASSREIENESERASDRAAAARSRDRTAPAAPRCTAAPCKHRAATDHPNT